jgi:GMP synthase (glutamine-hydrolysing)
MNHTRHIAIVDPAVKIAEVDCFNRLVMRSKLPLTYHLPGLAGTDSLHAANGKIAGVMILGSATSVYDDLPWQRPLEAWLRPLIDGGTPVLGLCYGHQMLAHMLGGKVGFLHPDKTKRSGFHPVTLEPDRLWGGKKKDGKLFMSHREVVTTVPPGMRAVGRSKESATEAIAHEKLPVWGLQAHPEATAGFLKNHGLPPADEAAYAFGHSLVDAFLDYAADKALGAVNS